MRLAAAISIIALVVASAAFARGKAPDSPPPVVTLGQVIERQLPAMIPKFAAQRSIPAGLADREWAIRNTFPSFGLYGCSFSFYGCYFGSYGFGGGYGCFASGASIETGDTLP